MGGGGLYVVAGQQRPVNSIYFYTQTREVMWMWYSSKLNVVVSVGPPTARRYIYREKEKSHLNKLK